MQTAVSICSFSVEDIRMPNERKKGESSVVAVKLKWRCPQEDLPVPAKRKPKHIFMLFNGFIFGERTEVCGQSRADRETLL